LVAAKADGAQQLFQEATGGTDEGAALLVLVEARRLPQNTISASSGPSPGTARLRLRLRSQSGQTVILS
ncbi:unnamed protein product, partial [marine sediment metagenome]